MSAKNHPHRLFSANHSAVARPGLLLTGMVLCLGFVLLLVQMVDAADSSTQGTSNRQVVDRIVAIVNNEVITMHDLRRAVSPLMGEEGNAHALLDAEIQEEQTPGDGSEEPEVGARRRLLRSTLDDLISETLVSQEAEKLQITVGGDEVSAFIDGIKQQYGWDDATLEENILAQGSTMEAYRDDIRRRLQSSRLVQMRVGSKVNVSEAEISERFRRLYGEEGVEIAISARHILVMLPPEAEGEAVKEAEERIQGAQERLEAGEDFASVAIELSEGPSAVRGGELGRFRRGSLDATFEDAAFEASEGEVVGPVRTSFGLHLILVNKRETVPMADTQEARQRIHQELHQQAMERHLEAWTAELRQKSFVETRL